MVQWGCFESQIHLTTIKAFNYVIRHIYLEMYTWYRCHFGQGMVTYLECIANSHNNCFTPYQLLLPNNQAPQPLWWVCHLSNQKYNDL